MTRVEKLGVAVVGLGVGARHARAFGNHPACRMRYLLDLDISLANSLASEFSDCTVARTYSEIIESRDVDVVVIASYDDTHYAQVMDALLAGKHVFVEKPLCQTYKELQNIKKVWFAAPKPVILRSNLVLRSAPYYQWLKNTINEGRLGKIYAIDGDYLYGRVHKITEGWRSGVEEYSVMEGGGVHLIDMVIWITGQRPVSVTASGNRICTEGTSFRYHDYVAASFEFESGLIARVTANFGCVHRHHHVLRVFGTKATALYDDAGPRLHTSRDPEMPVESIKLPALPLDKSDLIPRFVDAILSNHNDQNETQSFFDGISISVAASRALMTGRKERIKYI
jgi:predicted dehydrogenase